MVLKNYSPKQCRFLRLLYQRAKRSEELLKLHPLVLHSPNNE